MIIRSCRVDSEVSASLKVLVNMMTRVVTSSYTTCRQVYRSKSLLFQHLFIASVTPGRIPLESCKFQALAFQDRTCKFFFVYLFSWGSWASPFLPGRKVWFDFKECVISHQQIWNEKWQAIQQVMGLLSIFSYSKA